MNKIFIFSNKINFGYSLKEMLHDYLSVKIKIKSSNYKPLSYLITALTFVRQKIYFVYY